MIWALANWKLLAVGAAVLVLGGMLAIARIEVGSLRNKVASVERDRDTYRANAETSERVANENARTAQDLAAKYAAAEATAATVRADNAALATTLAKTRKAIHDAPQADDGPISRVLATALDSLR